jgi:DNA-binding NarL/FixJ family response regulator
VPPFAGCGVPGLVRLTAAYLEAAGARCAPHAPLRLLIDAPPTFASCQLACAPPPGPTIVVTGNTCPEYVADLWEAQPAIVIVGDDVQADVIAAVRRASQGERYCMAPGAPRLRPGDRAVLRMLALGGATRPLQLRYGSASKPCATGCLQSTARSG